MATHKFRVRPEYNGSLLTTEDEVPSLYSETIGDTLTTEFDIEHGFNTENVFVQVRRNADKAFVLVAWDIQDADTIRVYFDTPPGINEYSVWITNIPLGAAKQ